jgi:hypothetical protein
MNKLYISIKCISRFLMYVNIKHMIFTYLYILGDGNILKRGVFIFQILKASRSSYSCIVDHQFILYI